jgi:hypothetical protein
MPSFKWASGSTTETWNRNRFYESASAVIYGQNFVDLQVYKRIMDCCEILEPGAVSTIAR